MCLAEQKFEIRFPQIHVNGMQREFDHKTWVWTGLIASFQGKRKYQEDHRISYKDGSLDGHFSRLIISVQAPRVSYYHINWGMASTTLKWLHEEQFSLQSKLHVYVTSDYHGPSS